MKINRRMYTKMMEKIYDVLLGKDGDYVVYISPAMHAYIVMICASKVINNHVVTILGFPVLPKTGLRGKDFEVIKND